ncbi:MULTISPECIES: hypothetical protein [Pseudomonas]|uniref:Uncharacterized protein n=1 Tax=Pseudomonas fulva TaxID=47880 RepID=A0A0D0JQM6_9PSED|nr:MULTISPECIES: hypothetical protein [Pseudomonas]KIP97668.1 hypothetical protein RU08_17360 [Pseudomonas fulva]
MNNFSDIVFQTEAGCLMFSPVKVCDDEGFFDFKISCALAKNFSRFLQGDFACRLYGKDIERLVAQFDKHVRGLILGEYAQSLSYVPLESDIQIQFLDGEVIDVSDGYFSIIILFNCGKADEASSNTYFGLETVVEVSDFKSFCEGLKRLIL